MDIVGKVRFLVSDGSTIPNLDSFDEIHFPTSDKPESLCCLKTGKLIHLQGGKILACADINKTRPFSQFGPVVCMNYFMSLTKIDCVAILQEKCFSIWQSHLSTFIQRHFEEVDGSAKINAFDYFSKGSDQVALSASDTIRYFEVGYGGLVHEIKTSKDESKVVDKSLTTCLHLLTTSIQKYHAQTSDAKLLTKTILLKLEGSNELLLDDLKLSGQISKRPRRTLIEKEKKSLQTGAKFFEHLNELLGILRIENTSNLSFNDLVLLPCVCEVERLSYKIYHNCNNKLESGKSLKLIVQFNRGIFPWKSRNSMEKIFLQYVDSECGYTHRKVLNHTAFQDTESSTQPSHPDYEKLVALKKIYVKKHVVIRSEFSNGKQVLQILEKRLGFIFDENLKVYMKSGDKTFFFSCSEELDTQVSLTLHGKDEGVLKTFVHKLYPYLPDDMYMTTLDNDSQVSKEEPKSNQLELLRSHLLAEISALEDIFKNSSPASVARVEQHIESSKSVYESRRQMVLSKSVSLRIPLEIYMQSKSHLLKLEDETDKIFSELLK